MHFDGIEAEPVGAAGRRRKRFMDASHPGLVEGEGRRFFRVEGNGRRSDDLPAAFRHGNEAFTLPGNPGRSLAPGVGQLDCDGHGGVGSDRL